jgi:hypothetical protein
MGSSDHARVGWPKGPSEGDRADHGIVGQDRHQMMRRFTGWWGAADRIIGRLSPHVMASDLFLLWK